MVSETDFFGACLDLITLTDYFDEYENDEIKFIEESHFAIRIIVKYLHTFTDKMKNSEKEFRKKFHEIVKQIASGAYGLAYSPEHWAKIETHWTKISLANWTEIELTTCGAIGPFGPSLEDCVSTYKSDWSKNKKLFNVDPHRSGIQKMGRTKLKHGELEIMPELVQEMDFVSITKYIFYLTSSTPE